MYSFSLSSENIFRLLRYIQKDSFNMLHVISFSCSHFSKTRKPEVLVKGKAGTNAIINTRDFSLRNHITALGSRCRLLSCSPWWRNESTLAGFGVLKRNGWVYWLCCCLPLLLLHDCCGISVTAVTICECSVSLCVFLVALQGKMEAGPNTLLPFPLLVLGTEESGLCPAAAFRWGGKKPQTAAASHLASLGLLGKLVILQVWMHEGTTCCAERVYTCYSGTQNLVPGVDREIVWEQGIQVTDQVWALRTRLVSDGPLLSGSVIKFQGHIFSSYMKIDCFSQYLDKCRPVWLFQRKLLHLALSFKSSLWPSHHHPVCFQDKGENTDCVFMAEFSCYKKDKTLTKSKVGFEIFYDSTVRNFYIPYKESNHFLLIVAQSVFPKRLININMIKINNNKKKRNHQTLQDRFQ